MKFRMFVVDPFSGDPKLFQFVDKKAAYNWFNKTLGATMKNLNNTRKITFKSGGLITNKTGDVIGMWKEETQ